MNLTPQEFAARYPALSDPSFDYAHCEAISADACSELTDLRRALVHLQADPKELAVAHTVVESAVSLYLVRRGSYGIDPAKGGGEAVGSAKSERDGIRYRVPAAGYLYICERDQSCLTGSDAPIVKASGPLAQLGMVFNVPFSSPAFASGGISITFDDQGRLLRAGLKRDNAVALTAAQAAGSVTDQYAAYFKTRDNRELADLNKAVNVAKAKKDLLDAEQALVKTPTEDLKDQLALLDAQQKVEAAKAALGPNQTTDLTNQIAIAKLQVDLADQEAKLKADPDANVKAVKAAYDAQTALLQAQKSELEAEAAVAEAKRQLAATPPP